MWLSFVKSEFLSFPLTCHYTQSSQETKLPAERKSLRADKYGLPLLGASGLSSSARAEIQTKAIKTSAIYTFPKQDCGIHSPLSGMRSPWWRWHHRAGRDSQQCLQDNIFFTRAPSTNETGYLCSQGLISLKPRNALCLYQVSLSVLDNKILYRYLFTIFLSEIINNCKNKSQEIQSIYWNQWVWCILSILIFFFKKILMYNFSFFLTLVKESRLKSSVVYTLMRCSLPKRNAVSL